ncbi:MAG: serine/threonine-protein kinase [Isosphaeraceae bacterium]
MIAETDMKPRSLFENGQSDWGLGSVLSSISGASHTWVMEELSTGIRIARRWAPQSDSESARRPAQSCGPRRPLGSGYQLGPYRLLERLGRGAQGEVWKAMRCDASAELVAIKILNPSLSHNPARMAQFRREAERGVRLAGPSLLTIYELGSIDGHHFMAMPYVEGTTMREVVRSRSARLDGRPDAETHHLVDLDEWDYLRAMTRLLAEATRALALAHEQRIAHRDIKPANILLDNRRPDKVYLCDFGLGRDLEVATSEQMRDGAGTPMYMAPERLLRVAADEVRCDIYSMGVTIFEALTLQRPFHVPDHVALPSLPAYLSSTPPRRPSDVRPGFPAEYEAVILKAMARNPDHRYESAGHLAEALEQIDIRWTFRRSRAPIDGPHSLRHRRPHCLEGFAPNASRGARAIAGNRAS